jgi:hypothetical protein
MISVGVVSADPAGLYRTLVALKRGVKTKVGHKEYIQFIQNLSGVRTLSKTLREQEHYYEIFTESHALALRLGHRHHNARRNLSHIDIIHTPPVTRTVPAVRQSVHSV